MAQTEIRQEQIESADLSTDVTGVLPVANGGTNAATASGARTSLDIEQTISGRTLPTATVASDDKVLIQDTSDSDNLKTVTAQSVADLGGGGSGGYTTIQEEGSSLTQRDTLNFIGSGLTAADDAGNTRTNVALDPTLNSLAGFNSDGFVVQTASDTFTSRDIQGTTDEIDITNGDGVSGNPIIGISDNAEFPGTQANNMAGGTTAQRGTPVEGDLRQNTTTNLMEYYNGSNWLSLDKTILSDQVLSVAGNFTSITVPAGIRHVELFMNVKSSASVTSDYILLELNGNTTNSDYTIPYLYAGEAYSPAAAYYTDRRLAFIVSSSSLVDSNSQIHMQMFNVDDTSVYKEAIVRTNSFYVANVGWIQDTSVLFESTAAITSIEFSALTTPFTFAAGSKLIAYGYV